MALDSRAAIERGSRPIKVEEPQDPAVITTPDGRATPEAGADGPGLGRRRGGRGPMPYRVSRRLRVGRWQGDPYVALIGPARTGRGPRATEIRQCTDGLIERGVTKAYTSALSAFEAEPFYQAGFELHERLHLLACKLHDLPQVATRADDPKTIKLKSGLPWHNKRVLAVDHRAFTGFWRFDEDALRESKTATPARRFRVAVDRGRIVGYAVTGQSGDRGYLQRLAVDPDMQGRGVGSALIRDSFGWLLNRGAHVTLVNTQETNEGALSLYRRMGYRQELDGLHVLSWSGSS